MSLFRYGEFETELDFTDVDTLESIEDAYEKLQEDVKNLPKTGRTSEIIKAQIAVYDEFFDSFMGMGPAAGCSRQTAWSLGLTLQRNWRISGLRKMNGFMDGSRNTR